MNAVAVLKLYDHYSLFRKAYYVYNVYYKLVLI